MNHSQDLELAAELLLKALRVKKNSAPFQKSYLVQPAITHVAQAMDHYIISLIHHRPIAVFPKHEFSEPHVPIAPYLMGYANPDLRKLNELHISYDFWEHASFTRPEPILIHPARYVVPPKEKKLPRKAKKAFIKSLGRLAYRARYRKNYKEYDAQKSQKSDDNILSMCL